MRRSNAPKTCAEEKGDLKMNDKQIREAVEICNSIKDDFREEKDLHTDKQVYSTPAVFSYEKNYGKAFNILLSLAQSYLAGELVEPMNEEEIKKLLPEKEYCLKGNHKELNNTGFGCDECVHKAYVNKIIDKCKDALVGHIGKPTEAPNKVITFDKSALKDICKALDVPYDENIIGFTKYGVIRKEAPKITREELIKIIDEAMAKEYGMFSVDFVEGLADAILAGSQKKQEVEHQCELRPMGTTGNFTDQMGNVYSKQ